MGFQLKTTLLKYQTGISMETSFKFDTENRKWLHICTQVWHWI